MSPTRFRQAVLLAAALLLAATAAHARKDDEERGNPEGRGQQVEQPHRGGDDGYRPQRDEGRERVQNTRRYEPRGARGEPVYTDPRRGPEPRSYDVSPRRYDGGDTPRPRGYNAPPPRYDSEPRYAPRGMSLSEAVSEAQRRSGGRVLSAEPGSDGGQPYYRIKVLAPNGRVQTHYIDAR